MLFQTSGISTLLNQDADSISSDLIMLMNTLFPKVDGEAISRTVSRVLSEFIECERLSSPSPAESHSTSPRLLASDNYRSDIGHSKPQSLEVEHSLECLKSLHPTHTDDCGIISGYSNNWVLKEVRCTR